MNMTIFVDASWCPRTLAGGVGAWVKKDGWSKGYTLGEQLEKTTSSSCAELLGIHRTIKFLHEQGDLADVQVLMLQCDNTNALAAIMRWGGFDEAATKGDGARVKLQYAATFRAAERAWAKGVGEWTSHMRSRLVRHVRGHQQGTTTRSWVNEKCDEIAKANMRRARREAFARTDVAQERVREPRLLRGLEAARTDQQPAVLVGFGIGLASSFSQVPEGTD
ncbi:ribonuclease H protein [Rhizobium phage RHph_X3_2]|nr:ribonuclease H protein [Rhizobium phage RHph_X3_2]